MKKVMLFLTGVLLVLLPLLQAQEGRGKGRLIGTVADEEGKPLEGVTLTLRSLQYDFTLTTTSDQNGKWSFFGFGKSIFELTMVKEGYITIKAKMPLSGLGRNNEQNLVMRVGTSNPEGTPGDPTAVPEEHLNWIKQAEAFQQARDFAQAEPLYRQFLEAHPQLSQYQINLGNCLLELKKPEEAIAAFDKALAGLKAANPDLKGDATAAALMASIGTARDQLGQTEAAAEACRESARLVPPTDPALAYNLAEILMAGNDSAGALEYYLLAHKLNDKEPKYLEKMGYAYLNMGEIPKSIEAFEAFLRMAPKAPQAEEIRSMVQGLKQ